MESINQFLSTASSFVSSSFHSISKGATLADLFSRAVRNPLVIGGVVTATAASVVLCALKCKKVRTEKEAQTVIWTVKEQADSIKKGENLIIEVEPGSKMIRYFDTDIDGKRRLIPTYDKGKYFFVITAEEMKGKNTIHFNIIKYQELSEGSYFSIKIDKI